MTAHIVAEKLDFESKIRKRKELQEADMGELAGRKKMKVKEKHPQYKSDVEYVFPEGESYSQMKKGVLGFIKSLESKHSQENVLVVTHRGCIRAALSYFLDLDYEENLDLPVSNQHLSKFKIKNRRDTRLHRDYSLISMIRAL